ncbi:MAG: hypothetical protein DME26_06785 [Verrucomicrobia bacterium]|nr:MAG: hypothetical protein DME26_06785 [Verrucomicrobiota bacterium]
MRFANNNGAYALSVWYSDDPATVYHWSWTDQAVEKTNRVGVAIWDMADAHYTCFRATELPTLAAVVPFKISRISVTGGNVVLDISKPTGSSYHVLRATDVAGPYTTNAANQSGVQYTEAVPVGTLP